MFCLNWPYSIHDLLPEWPWPGILTQGTSYLLLLFAFVNFLLQFVHAVEWGAISYIIYKNESLQREKDGRPYRIYKYQWNCLLLNHESNISFQAHPIKCKLMMYLQNTYRINWSNTVNRNINYMDNVYQIIYIYHLYSLVLTSAKLRYCLASCGFVGSWKVWKIIWEKQHKCTTIRSLLLWLHISLHVYIHQSGRRMENSSKR